MNICVAWGESEGSGAWWGINL